MENLDETPQWCMDLFLDFISNVKDNGDKFKSTGSALILDQNKKGCALHNPKNDTLTFIATRKDKSDELEHCYIKTTFENG